MKYHFSRPPFGRLIQRLILVNLFLVIFIALFTTYSKADNFIPYFDIANCNLAMTNTLSYPSLPSKSVSVGGFDYDSSHVSGSSGANFIESTRFSPNLGDMRYPNAHRYQGVSEAVSVPPNTRVDVGMYFYNHSGHDVFVRDVHLFTSASDTNAGDWTRLGAGGNYGTIGWNDHGSNISRGGKFVTLSPNRNVTLSEGQSPVGQRIYSFYTIQPIQIRGRSLEHSFLPNGELVLRIKNLVENTSSYSLNNISFTTNINGRNLVTTRNIAAKTTLEVITEYNYGLNYPKSIFIPSTTIHDPNFHTEITTTPDQASMVASRNDSGYPNTFGNQIDYRHNQNRMSITLIPYTLYSQTNSLNLSENLIINKVVSDNNENDVKRNSLNGLEDLTYKIQVNNSGARAENVRITDTYDSNYLEILEVSNGGSIHPESSQIRWVLPRINYGEQILLTVKARVKEILPEGNYFFQNNVRIDGSNLESKAETDLEFSVTHSLEKLINPNQYLRNNFLKNEGKNSLEYLEYADDLFVQSHEEKDIIENNLYFQDKDSITFKLLFQNNGNGISENTVLTDTIPISVNSFNGEKDLNKLLKFLDDNIEIVSFEGISEEIANIFELEYIENQVKITWQIGDLVPTVNKNSITYKINLNFDEGLVLSDLGEGESIIENVVSLDSDSEEEIFDSAIFQIVQPEVELTKKANYFVENRESKIDYEIKLINQGSGIFQGSITDLLPYILNVDMIETDGIRYYKDENGFIHFEDIVLNPLEEIKIIIKTTLDTNLDKCQEYKVLNTVKSIDQFGKNEISEVETFVDAIEVCNKPIEVMGSNEPFLVKNQTIDSNYRLSDTGQGGGVMKAVMNLFTIISSSLSVYYIFRMGGLSI